MRAVFKKLVAGAISLGLLAVSGMVLSSCQKQPSKENSEREKAFRQENEAALANAQASYEKKQAELAAKKAGGGKPGASPDAKTSPAASASPAVSAPPPGPGKSGGQ